MLDQETKRKIDNARDILVGKVPDPKSQVEQITIALIYKFMDDMDKESVALGGKAAFFKGEYEKYTWSRIFDPKLGGFDLITLYSEAITTMNHNENIPQLFRDIFKNAFLPYRDPETLKSFLKEINEFKYDHSEKLGDAFEYLLSVLGSQGDAGQFRTPRHIIDFIVSVVDPQKNESILDPACGTAGFLISSFKHILQQNTKERKGDCLTMDERKSLMNNLVGYDISPDMVRLSLVNMYLHGFQTPKIYEYDTLTSEEKWNEAYDVILANPPFMTPKGGIRPHKRFSVQANRSEVLFVDYIMEHISTNGRGGVIVPEGIIFQSANAYKALRKLLVDTHLFAVVSLPSGVFQPYAGVKTSILLMDRTLAKRALDILFVKLESDGFDLGAQRRPNGKSDLPAALSALLKFRRSLHEGKECEFSEEEKKLAHRVARVRIAEGGDYNLSGERYKETIMRSNKGWKIVELGEVCEKILSGGTPSTEIKEYWEGNIPWITSADISGIKDVKPRRFITKQAIDNSATNLIPENNIIVVTRVGLGKLLFNDFDLCISQDSQGLIVDKSKIVPEYLVYLLSEEVKKFKDNSRGSTIQGVTKSQLTEIKIPLPPLSVQQEIVAEIEGYQKVVDGARQVVENYKPKIKVDEGWEVVELGEVSENLDSKRKPVTKSDRKNGTYPYYGASGIVDYVDDFIFNEDLLLISEDGANLISRNTPIAFSISGKTWVNNHAHVLRFKNIETQKFIEFFLNSINLENYITGCAQPKINQDKINKIPVPLPPFDVQKQIVARIEEEQKLVDANRKLIELFEGKIKANIAEVWR